MKKISYEEYRLVLTHSYIDEDGERTMLDEPVNVAQVIPLDRSRQMIPPVSVCINDMMDRMKQYILRRAENG